MDFLPVDGVPDLTGTMVAGKYRVERLVGTGGMGTVWEGRHVVLGTRVAIKFIKPAYVQHAESRQRFEIEARAAALLQTKHAVQVFDYGLTDDGMPYIVMEYLQGETLSDALVRRGPLPAAEAVQFILQAAKALQKAHEAGVVHRDLKPDNVFLARSEETDGLPYTVKLVDFGIAKIMERDAPAGGRMGGPTAEGTVIGTPNFMSPEQLTMGGAPDPISDLWALGACAFTAFCARIPFEGEVLGDIVLRVCASPLPVPSQLNPSVPAAFDAWFAKACHRDRTKRFQTAEEAAQALQAACGPRTALEEDRVQYVLRPNPSYVSMADDLPEPSAMSPRTALLAGLVLGVTVMVGMVAFAAWRDRLSTEEAERSILAAPASDAGATKRDGR